MFYLSGLVYLLVLLNDNLPVALESLRHLGKYSYLNVLDNTGQLLLGFVKSISSTMNCECNSTVLKKPGFHVEPQAS